MGGVGMMGLALARVLFERAPLVADIDPAKRAAALAAGAVAAFDPEDASARKAIIAATGDGAYGVIDFVGSERSLGFATGALAKGGKVVVIGLIGGTIALPVAMFALKAFTIEGSQTGKLADARALIDLVRTRKLDAPPIRERPLGEAQVALDALRAGQVVGRTVLAM
jgi:alcohol dehydrogenase